MRVILICAMLFNGLAAFSANRDNGFKENKGQVCDQDQKARPDVLFSGTSSNLVYHLKNKGISYQLRNTESIYRVDVNWVGANDIAKIEKGEALREEENFYTDRCSALNVKQYKQLTYQNIYKGIDLKWYYKNGNLEYDYIVSAGSDHKQIKFQFNGAEKISINVLGQLVVNCPLGQIIEDAPLVYQNNKTLKANWVIENNIVSFNIKNIDASKSFVIDPTVAARMWGTYYGGTGDETANSTCTDASGNVCIAGVTTTSVGTNIATSGSYQTIFGTGTNDAFLVKFDNNGNRLWATYYGDAGDETAFACATDASGNVFMSGISGSSGGTVIASTVSHQNFFGGGNYDCFLVKFNSSGVRQWGTYYGGVADDFGQAVTTDASGNVYLGGYTSSTGSLVISTNGAHQSIKSIGSDAFLAKFNSSGVRQWGTYYGGNGPEWAYSCATDPSGNVYMAGVVSITTGTAIATLGSHQPVKGASNDAYLVKFNSAGVRQWGTFYGGSGSDNSYACSTDAFGNIFLSGISSTSVGTAVATASSHQNTFAGINDAFVAKFDAAGLRQWGTYYGGTANEFGFTGVTTDATGNVYISGTTVSSGGTVIATVGSYEEIYGGGASDGYLVKLDSAGVRQWGTYYGGTGDEKGNSCAKDNSGNLFLCGNSTTTTNIVIANSTSHQSNFGGGTTDAYLVKFNDCTIPNSPTNTSLPINLNICAGNTTTISATATGTVSWFMASSGGTAVATGTNYIVSPTLTTIYYAQNLTCLPSATRTAVTVSVSSCIGINELHTPNSELIIYPNPSNGDFTIEADQKMELNIVNELGEVVRTISIQNQGKQQISLSNLSSGIYFIVGQSEKESYRQKIVVVK